MTAAIAPAAPPNRGLGLLLRAVWFVFIGWWLTSMGVTALDACCRRAIDMNALGEARESTEIVESGTASRSFVREPRL